MCELYEINKTKWCLGSIETIRYYSEFRDARIILATFYFHWKIKKRKKEDLTSEYDKYTKSLARNVII